MSDTTTESTAPVEETAAPAPEATDVPVPDVTAQENKTVGDENLPDPREVQVEVVQEQVAAQVVQPREGDTDKVNVHEVSVTTDEVITDTSSPLAVQVPDAGRSPLQSSGLPISRLSGEGAEAVFAREASKTDE